MDDPVATALIFIGTMAVAGALVYVGRRLRDVADAIDDTIFRIECITRKDER